MLFQSPRTAVFPIVAAIGAVWLCLALLYPAPGITAEWYLLAGLLLFLARALPVTSTRERPVTFVAAVVCAGTVVVGPWAAGTLALGIYVVDSLLFRRQNLWHDLEDNVLCTLATAPLAVLYHLFSLPVPLPGVHLRFLAVLVPGAILYFVCTAAPLLLALRFATPARREDVRMTLAAQTTTFFAGLLLVGLLIGLREDNFLVGLLVFAISTAAIVGAIRATMELSTLRKQVQATEVLGRQAVEAQDEGALLAHLLAAARDLVAFDQAAIWATDPSDARLEIRAAWPERIRTDLPESLEFGEGIVGRVAERRRGIIIAAGSDPRWRGAVVAPGLSAKMTSALVVPLTTAERTVGVALFAHTDPGRYAPRDMKLMQSVANLVASAIENVRLHQNLRALAVTDELTGLLNRRRLQQILTEEVWRARRYERPLSVILCDVDNFKQYNDTYGHPQGDEVLRRVARVLKNSTRTVDSVARYGGEEFCVILPETGRLQAERMAERLRLDMEQAAFPGEGGADTEQRTMSFGVASYPEDMRDPEQLIPLADAALYRAKREGKNQVQGVRSAPATAPGPARRSRRIASH